MMISRPDQNAMHSFSDAQLVASYLADASEDTLRALIERHVDALYTFISRYIGGKEAAEDITQETFVKAWSNLRSFDTTRSFKTWLFNIAKNAAIDFLRKKKNIPFSDLADEEGNNPIVDSISDPEPLPNELLARLESKRELESVLQRLPPKYRIVLMMHYQDDLSLAEIADLLALPLNTVKSQHRRGLLAMRDTLISHVDAP